MSILIRADNNLASLANAPSSSSSPDGSSAFPLAMAGFPYPPGSVPLYNYSSGAATAISTNLQVPAGKLGYLAGINVTGGGATTGSIITLTASTGLSPALIWYIGIPGGVLLGVDWWKTFTPPLPGSGLGTWITLGLPSFGAGNTNAEISLYGYAL